MASASSAILVLFNSAISTAIVIAFTFEITRMTAGTEWRVPFLIWIIVIIDTATYRSSVTVNAGKSPSVVSRVVTLSAMTKVGWCPAVGCMAHVTLFIRA